jgi:hypothetical protein
MRRLSWISLFIFNKWRAAGFVKRARERGMREW